MLYKTQKDGDESLLKALIFPRSTDVPNDSFYVSYPNTYSWSLMCFYFIISFFFKWFPFRYTNIRTHLRNIYACIVSIWVWFSLSMMLFNKVVLQNHSFIWWMNWVEIWMKIFGSLNCSFKYIRTFMVNNANHFKHVFCHSLLSILSIVSL